ncbi:MAG: galactokinase [Ruminococcus sp.]|nr:galactokinase [Ruminococcus sp.]
MNIRDVLQKLENNAFFKAFEKLYGSSEDTLRCQKQRYLNAVQKFAELYPKQKEIHIYSAPGRTEIGGNHTDHQHGCVLAAAVNLDAIAVAAFHRDGVIRVKSEGYDAFTVKLDDLSVQSSETGTPAVIRGIAAKFSSLGEEIGGFDLYCTSDVLSGSGISSSAAFETLIGTIIDSYYNDNKAGAVEIAKIGQFAENVYFGKKSGLMDQMVSSVGGLVSIDFYDTENPGMERFDFDFEQHGCGLCITDTKGSHADLTGDYDAIRSEMEEIASYFGKPYLREVSETAFYDAIPKLRETCSDRAILRGAHFFSENSRALQEAEALKAGDMEEFLRLVNASGDSSAQLLQNLYSNSQPMQQQIPLAIMMSKRILDGRGAVRVHGGGFAGTIQAFVPLELADTYAEEMNRIFGDGSCQKLHIRPVGGVELTKEEA